MEKIETLIECPRCGSKNIKEENPSKSSLKEYICLDCEQKAKKNNEETLDHSYFQYEKMDETYSWPAIGVQYQCHKDDLDDVRNRTITPDFV